ncbi:MAG TPA: decaprenyl-phosphate phosphoribosyltransferase [Acidimicrobiales bacterium]|nr:decaprenyl-phosphate phosphoribosyltransferase [Acidimicrobiales bacterium]
MVRAIPTDQSAGAEQLGLTERQRRPSGVIRIARPRQWLKNVLVFAAPGAAGVLTELHPLLRTAAAFGIFCLAASGTYFLNDVLDAGSDRHHPVKRLRPVAAGEVPEALALGIGLGLMLGAVALAWAVAGHRLALVIALYVVLSGAYSLRLKHVPILDMAVLSSGFILRAIAGGVAAGVRLSDWFVIVTSFGSLLIAAGKRSAEHGDLGAERTLHRPVLSQYPAAFLRSIRLLASSVTVTAYCLWAFERSAAAGHAHHPIWFELSIVPVVLALLHLELRFEQGHGGAPEDMAWHDRMLQGLGLAWVVLFAVGIYG